MTAAGSAEGTIRVVIADDEDGFRESLRALVDGQPELRVVGSAADGLAAIERTTELQPDAVVMDLHMPRLGGVHAIARLRRSYPQLCLIALTGDPEPELHRAARNAGADEVFLKNNLLDTLMSRLAAVRRS